MKLRTTSIVLALISLAGCGSDPDWNVVLITMTATRVDHLGITGNQSAQTPHIDTLATEGTRFTRAYSPVPLALPAHASIMTGMYPMAHGVRDNGFFVLEAKYRGMASVLKSQGYATGAFVASASLASRFGINTGFDHFDELAPEKDQVVERPATEVTSRALEWLNEHANQPFFMWVNYSDAKPPFQAPTPYSQSFAYQAYDGEIAYIDENIGLLVARLRQRGVLDKCIIVLTADRGESLGEHGEGSSPMLVYNSTLHVPLVFRVPGAPLGLVVDTPVTTVDIAPTVYGLLGIDDPEQVQGRNLGAAIQGKRTPESIPIYAENLAAAHLFGWSAVRVLIDGDFKYISGSRAELFDLVEDPGESANLLSQYPDRAKKMSETLNRFLDRAKRDGANARRPTDIDIIRQLIGLGYECGLSGALPTPPDQLETVGRAPQDHMDEVVLLGEIRRFFAQGRFDDALSASLDLVGEDPANPAYLETLALSQLHLGWLDDALATLVYLEGLVHESEGTAEFRRRLAEKYIAVEQPQRALELLVDSGRIAPSASLYFLSATALALLGDEKGQEEALHSALVLDPHHGPARIEIAILRAESGDIDGAELSFKRALRDQPFAAASHYNYAVFLMQQNQFLHAETALKRALRLSPEYPQALHAMVEIQRRLGQDDDADRWLKRLRARAPHFVETQVSTRSDRGGL